MTSIADGTCVWIKERGEDHAWRVSFSTIQEAEAFNKAFNSLNYGLQLLWVGKNCS